MLPNVNEMRRTSTSSGVADRASVTINTEAIGMKFEGAYRISINDDFLSHRECC